MLHARLGKKRLERVKAGARAALAGRHLTKRAEEHFAMQVLADLIDDLDVLAEGKGLVLGENHPAVRAGKRWQRAGRVHAAKLQHSNAASNGDSPRFERATKQFSYYERWVGDGQGVLVDSMAIGNLPPEIELRRAGQPLD